MRVEDITSVVEKGGVWAPILYVSVLLLTYIIAPLSGTPVFFAGYLLFGKTVQIYNYVAALIGAVANFWIARKLGRGRVSDLIGAGNMKKIDQFTNNYGIKSLVLLRILQGQFHDFIAFAYGLTNIKFIPYLIVSALAPIPWFLLWYFYIFDHIQTIGDLTIWLLLTVAPLYIVSLFLVQYLRRS